jgi:protein-S-isoprenylcysteine O-methyltransferase Ste14
MTLRQPPEISRKSFVVMGVMMPLYLVIGVACLIQWGAPNPWVRLDWFSVTYLGLSAALGLEQTAFALRLPGSPDVLGEVFGTRYDPKMALLLALLAIGDLAGFIDYGHLHLVAQLAWPPLQIAGLILCMLTIVWQLWVDRHLARHFASGLESRDLIVTGPYRYMRHPRYAGLMASRIGFSLAIASVLAWVLVLGWFLALRRRIKLEERHLDGVFGASYSEYAARTARLIPGLY